jgi:hypothetical protein
MNNELEKRLKFLKCFRWMPGMAAYRISHLGERVPIRIVSSVEGMPEIASAGLHEGKLLPSGYVCCSGWNDDSEMLPDLSDPATIGCLILIYQEASGVYSCPNRVLTYVSCYGLNSPEAIKVLVSELETL